jgi:hypothetical protein
VVKEGVWVINPHALLYGLTPRERAMVMDYVFDAIKPRPQVVPHRNNLRLNVHFEHKTSRGKGRAVFCFPLLIRSRPDRIGLRFS